MKKIEMIMIHKALESMGNGNHCGDLRPGHGPRDQATQEMAPEKLIEDDRRNGVKHRFSHQQVPGRVIRGQEIAHGHRGGTVLP